MITYVLVSAWLRGPYNVYVSCPFMLERVVLGVIIPELPENEPVEPVMVDSETVNEALVKCIRWLNQLREDNAENWAASHMLFIASYALAQVNRALAEAQGLSNGAE